MTISFTRYVDINSAVSGTGAAATREYIGRLMTSNLLLPSQSFIEFSGGDMAADVGAYFGTSSEEYARTLFYAGFVSKSVSSPKKISFARWVVSDTAPMIFGAKPASLTALQAITSGSFQLTLGGVQVTLSPLNFSAAVSFANVATILQAAINAQSGGMFTGAVVSFDSTRGAFNLVGGVTGNANVVVTDGGQSTALALGWTVGAILSNGSVAETPDGALANSASVSDNFGSFDFMPALTEAQVKTVAQWNATQGIKYINCQEVAANTAAEYSADLINIAGVALTLNAVASEYPEMEPMILQAATDYTQRNAVQNYEYQQFGITPSVTNDADADTYDALRVNYNGLTQKAGRQLSFYQRGVLTGGTDAPTDMNVYANEIWLRDAAGVAMMNLLLALPEIPANSQGRGYILTALQGVVQQAIFNGTISIGKTLTPTQQLAVTTFTGDPTAWRQVQNSGYWLDVVIAPFTAPGGDTEYQATYTLVYSKNDVVRKIVGTHVLI